MNIITDFPFIFSTLLINSTHALYYLHLKTRNPLRLFLMFVLMTALWPIAFWIQSGWPLLVPVVITGYVALCMWCYRVFATNDSYSRIFLCGSLILASTQTTRLTLLYLLIPIIGLPAEEAVRIIVWLHPVVFVAATPLLFRYVRSKVIRMLDLAANQSWYLVGLPPILLTVMGGLTNAVLAHSPELPLIKELAVLMPLSIVAYFVSMYLFLVNHHDKTVLGQRLAASERLAETYEFYDRELAEKEARLQRLRHDFRHLIVHLEELARERDYDGILRELSAVSAASGQTAIKPFCENRTVNAVVSSYFSRRKNTASTAWQRHLFRKRSPCPRPIFPWYWGTRWKICSRPRRRSAMAGSLPSRRNRAGSTLSSKFQTITSPAPTIKEKASASRAYGRSSNSITDASKLPTRTERSALPCPCWLYNAM
ncbi:MAG: hypothetical protein LUG50_01655 [Planctomycetaceae bacterium]|nr:hypothetical protein [Planctomycetaceae bacterium]